MDANLVRGLLQKDEVQGLDLFFVSGEKERITKINEKESAGNILVVIKPYDLIINLNHVTKIKSLANIGGRVSSVNVF
ncbi:hypothetical protein [Staphylococcus sp. GDY8P100P]|uniref:hypothetical protein n=1 Tax=Staphylococcus sp. GDY8P100P TaxID=2804429 RepID=UPI001951D603|nr:hypothetical protein [Staphylococcus sp. GDY8P100P]